MQKHSSSKIGQSSIPSKIQSERPRKQVTNRLGSRQAIVSATNLDSHTTRKTKRIRIASIFVPKESREINEDEVSAIAESIKENGLQVPIEVRWVTYDSGKARWVLVAGNHRIEAMKLLKKKYIEALVVLCSKAQARRRTIAENLHRSDLTALERAEHIVEWGQLQKGAQSGHPSGGKQPHDAGISQTARELGYSRPKVQRAYKIVAIDPEAKATAKEVGLDKSEIDLLAIAKESTPKAQLAKVQELENKNPAKQSSTKVGANISRGNKKSKTSKSGPIHTTPRKSTYNDMITVWKRSPAVITCWNGLSLADKKRFRDDILFPKAGNESHVDASAVRQT